jgi:SAM-dependent methyltransferase
MVAGSMDPPPIDWEQARELNRVRWDALAAVHGQDAYYDTEGLVAGADSLTPEEDAALGSVRGLDALHVQCHIGFDAISLTRRGARVTGLDFSSASLDKAAALARRCGLEIEWVQADSTAIPPELQARFDIAYATIGVLCWIADVGAWMRSVHSTLRPGGRLVLIDTHPLQEMVAASQPLTFDMPYADDGGHRFEETGTYADPDARTPQLSSISYAHSLGEITTAAADSGFRIDELIEHLQCSFEHRDGIPRREQDGWWRLRADGLPLPLLYTLRATRPG